MVLILILLIWVSNPNFLKSKTMKTKNAILSLIMITLSTIIYFKVDILKELEKVKKESFEKDKIIQYQMVNIKEKNAMIEEGFNHVTRMQIIGGVEPLKDVIEYKDKIKTKLVYRKLNSIDLRDKK